MSMPMSMLMHRHRHRHGEVFLPRCFDTAKMSDICLSYELQSDGQFDSVTSLTVTSFVAAGGAVYVFGEGQSGQLGLGSNVIDASSPSCVTSLQNIKIRYTACGYNFTAAISGQSLSNL